MGLGGFYGYSRLNYATTVFRQHRRHRSSGHITGENQTLPYGFALQIDVGFEPRAGV